MLYVTNFCVDFAKYALFKIMALFAYLPDKLLMKRKDSDGLF